MPFWQKGTRLFPHSTPQASWIRPTASVVAMLLAMAASGCANRPIQSSPPPLIAVKPEDLQPPPPNHFPNRELFYTVAGPVDEVRRISIEFLTGENLQQAISLAEPYTYIITVWVMEPSQDTDRRARRTAYLVRLSPGTTSSCTNVAVNWIVESRGIRETPWSVKSDDVTFVPPLRKRLLDVFAARRCGK